MNHTLERLRKQSTLCHKANHYMSLEARGLPTPDWFYADAADPQLVDLIRNTIAGEFSPGISFFGIRCERKGCHAKAHHFPHVLFEAKDFVWWSKPEHLQDFFRKQAGCELSEDYNLVINSAFKFYYWHGVVALQENIKSHRMYELFGDVYDANSIDASPSSRQFWKSYGERDSTRLMLRPAMDDATRLTGAFNRHRMHPATRAELERVRRTLLDAAIFGEFVEVSYTVEGGLVYWGLR